MCQHPVASWRWIPWLARNDGGTRSPAEWFPDAAWPTGLAVTIHRGREAAGVVKEASDLTNELLRKNAENLRTANAEIRAEMERGVFDIEAIEKANDDLIATIEDSLRIADEGKAKRAAAEASLIRMEGELKDALASAKARATGSGDNIGGSV